MRILFDQNVPRALGRHLTPHPVTRAAEMGWQELKNGDLLAAAEKGEFDLLLTCDQNIEHQQKVTGRQIAILSLSTNNWPPIRARAEEIAVAVGNAMPGTHLAFDCGTFRRPRRSITPSGF